MVPAGSDPIRDLRALLAQGRYQEVLDRHFAAPPEWERGEPAIELAVATAATRLGRLGDGQVLAVAAHDEYRLHADDDGRMRCVNLLGAIAWERGQLDGASGRWAEALELARQVGDPVMTARVSNNLALAMHLTGRVAEARSHFRESLVTYRRLGERRYAAETAHNLAVTYREEGELRLADDADAEAVRHAELVADPALIALTITGRAETRLAQGDHPLAASDLARAERLCRGANDPLGLAEVRRVRGERWLRLRQPARALEEAEAARAVAAELGSALLQAECAALAYRALRQLDRLDEARLRFEEAERLFRTLGAVAHLRRLGETA